MNSTITTAFGRVLRQLRTAAGMTQEQLGLKADLQRKFISVLERGEKQPSLLTLFKLAAALDIKPGALVALIDAEIAEH